MKVILNIQGDEPTMLAMTQILEAEGYQVVNARNVGDPPVHVVPDLIVINTNMPELEKRSCVDALRMLVPGVMIIDLSVDATAQAHETGADEYLDKPFSPESLIASVKMALGDSSRGPSQDGHAPSYSQYSPP